MNKFFMALLFAGLILSGCDKDKDDKKDDSDKSTTQDDDDKDDDKGTAFDGKITAKVEDGSNYNGMIDEVMATIRYGHDDYDEFVTGSYSKGGFTLTLTTPKSNQLGDLEDFFGDDDGVKISKTGVKAGLVREIVAFNSEGDMMGIFFYAKEGSSSATEAYYFYVDKDVNITGSDDDYKYDLTLKKGWNIMYETYYESNTKKDELTTKTVSGLKWYFSSYDDDDDDYDDEW